MRRHKAFRSPVRMAALVLAVVSLLLFFLPQSWTAPIVNLAQTLLPFQQGAAYIGAATENLSPRDVVDLSPEQNAVLQQELAANQHRVLALSMRTAALESEVATLTATRQWTVDGRRIGGQGQLIPAQVITGDLLSWRDTRLIAAGALQGVRREAGVASAHFSIAVGQSDGLRDGMAILQAEVLIGFIEQVGTHAARVKLLTDPTVQMKVRTGRWTDAGFEPIPGHSWLTGRGKGRMELRDLDRREVDSGLIQVGDAVLCDPESSGLPVAVVVGQIRNIEPDRNNPLLSTAVVEPAIDAATLRKVYVYQPSGQG